MDGFILCDKNVKMMMCNLSLRIEPGVHAFWIDACAFGVHHMH